ncbi:hypothetical protein [Escherichia coli]|uniref:hypothetical protein n=1 Tax=Escherichia coli TaxID=562 RepID=UPI0021BABE94|nr:hypothetical protein [Escherichia coli]
MAEVVNDYSEIRAIFDRTAVPDNWLQLQKLNIGTAETLSSSLNRCLPATFMCTAGSIFLGYNGQANYILYLTREIATITDKAGNSYKFTVAFPDNVPVVGVYEKTPRGEEHGIQQRFSIRNYHYPLTVQKRLWQEHQPKDIVVMFMAAIILSEALCILIVVCRMFM